MQVEIQLTATVDQRGRVRLRHEPTKNIFGWENSVEPKDAQTILYAFAGWLADCFEVEAASAVKMARREG